MSMTTPHPYPNITKNNKRPVGLLIPFRNVGIAQEKVVTLIDCEVMEIAQPLFDLTIANSFRVKS